MLTLQQKAYLAGFLDGDGSIYVRLKPNPTYRYGFQVAPYIVLFQSQKDQKKFEEICALLIGFGHLRIRKDGILEYIISKNEALNKFLKMIRPFLILKRNQANLMLKILAEKERIKSREDFARLAQLIDCFRDLNYSKRRRKHILTL